MTDSSPGPPRVGAVSPLLPGLAGIEGTVPQPDGSFGTMEGVAE